MPTAHEVPFVIDHDLIRADLANNPRFLVDPQDELYYMLEHATELGDLVANATYKLEGPSPFLGGITHPKSPSPGRQGFVDGAWATHYALRVGCPDYTPRPDLHPSVKFIVAQALSEAVETITEPTSVIEIVKRAYTPAFDAEVEVAPFLQQVAEVAKYTGWSKGALFAGSGFLMMAVKADMRLRALGQK